eukprot:5596520-Pyramimonas_sp.AAC.1
MLLAVVVGLQICWRRPAEFNAFVVFVAGVEPTRDRLYCCDIAGRARGVTSSQKRLKVWSCRCQLKPCLLYTSDAADDTPC